MFPEHEIFGGPHLCKGGRARGEEVVSGLRLQLYPLLASRSHPSQVWPVLPLQCPDYDPGRGCWKAPTPTHLLSGLKHSRVTQEGGMKPGSFSESSVVPSPAGGQNPPPFLGTQMGCPIAQACRAHGSEPNFHSGKTWLIQGCSWQA